MKDCVARLGRRWFVAVVLFLTGLLGACATGSGPGDGATATLVDPNAPASASPASQGARIGLLLPLGGMDSSAAVSKAMKQAAELALFERDNPQIRLIVKDDKGTPEGARAAADQAINEGAEIILGPLFSASVPAAAEAARAAGIPLVAFSNDRKVAGNGVYLLSFAAEQEVPRVIGYALSQGKRRYAALIPDTTYGQLVEGLFRSSVEQGGGTIAAIERHGEAANQMLPAANRLFDAVRRNETEGTPVDAMFIPSDKETLDSIAPMIAYAGIDPATVKLIGTGVWDTAGIGRQAGIRGGWYPGADPKSWSGFSERFARTFGSMPPRIATLAYDGVSAAIALSGAPPPLRYTAAGLGRAQGFDGVDGIFRFDGSGLAQRELAVLEVQEFGPVVVDAPRVAGVAPLAISAGPVAGHVPRAQFR